jgi:DNA-binding NtrC family response regulator
MLARVAKRPVEIAAQLISPEALQVMMNHHWQGNVRELANAMEYAWIVSGGQAITPAHLPQDVRNPQPASVPLSLPVAGAAHPAASFGAAGGSTIPFPSGAAAGAVAGGGKSLADVEMEYILQVYAKNNMNKQATATELGISLKTLYNKLHKYEEERRMRAG